MNLDLFNNGLDFGDSGDDDKDKKKVTVDASKLAPDTDTQTVPTVDASGLAPDSNPVVKKAVKKAQPRVQPNVAQTPASFQAPQTPEEAIDRYNKAEAGSQDESRMGEFIRRSFQPSDYYAITAKKSGSFDPNEYNTRFQREMEYIDAEKQRIDKETAAGTFNPDDPRNKQSIQAINDRRIARRQQLLAPQTFVDKDGKPIEIPSAAQRWADQYGEAPREGLPPQKDKAWYQNETRLEKEGLSPTEPVTDPDGNVTGYQGKSLQDMSKYKGITGEAFGAKVASDHLTYLNFSPDEIFDTLAVADKVMGKGQRYVNFATGKPYDDIADVYDHGDYIPNGTNDFLVYQDPNANLYKLGIMVRASRALHGGVTNQDEVARMFEANNKIDEEAGYNKDISQLEKELQDKKNGVDNGVVTNVLNAIGDTIAGWGLPFITSSVGQELFDVGSTKDKLLFPDATPEEKGATSLGLYKQAIKNRYPDANPDEVIKYVDQLRTFRDVTYAERVNTLLGELSKDDGLAKALTWVNPVAGLARTIYGDKYLKSVPSFRKVASTAMTMIPLALGQEAGLPVMFSQMASATENDPNRNVMLGTFIATAGAGHWIGENMPAVIGNAGTGAAQATVAGLQFGTNYAVNWDKYRGNIPEMLSDFAIDLSLTGMSIPQIYKGVAGRGIEARVPEKGLNIVVRNSETGDYGMFVKDPDSGVLTLRPVSPENAQEWVNFNEQTGRHYMYTELAPQVFDMATRPESVGEAWRYFVSGESNRVRDNAQLVQRLARVRMRNIEGVGKVPLPDNPIAIVDPDGRITPVRTDKRVAQALADMKPDESRTYSTLRLLADYKTPVNINTNLIAGDGGAVSTIRSLEKEGLVKVDEKGQITATEEGVRQYEALKRHSESFDKLVNKTIDKFGQGDRVSEADVQTEFAENRFYKPKRSTFKYTISDLSTMGELQRQALALEVARGRATFNPETGILENKTFEVKTEDVTSTGVKERQFDFGTKGERNSMLFRIGDAVEKGNGERSARIVSDVIALDGKEDTIENRKAIRLEAQDYHNEISKLPPNKDGKVYVEDHLITKPKPDEAPVVEDNGRKASIVDRTPEENKPQATSFNFRPLAEGESLPKTKTLVFREADSNKVVHFEYDPETKSYVYASNKTSVVSRNILEQRVKSGKYLYGEPSYDGTEVKPKTKVQKANEEQAVDNYLWDKTPPPVETPVVEPKPVETVPTETAPKATTKTAPAKTEPAKVEPVKAKPKSNFTAPKTLAEGETISDNINTVATRNENGHIRYYDRAENTPSYFVDRQTGKRISSIKLEDTIRSEKRQFKASEERQRRIQDNFNNEDAQKARQAVADRLNNEVKIDSRNQKIYDDIRNQRMSVEDIAKREGMDERDVIRTFIDMAERDRGLKDSQGTLFSKSIEVISNIQEKARSLISLITGNKDTKSSDPFIMSKDEVLFNALGYYQGGEFNIDKKTRVNMEDFNKSEPFFVESNAKKGLFYVNRSVLDEINRAFGHSSNGIALTKPNAEMFLKREGEFPTITKIIRATPVGEYPALVGLDSNRINFTEAVKNINHEGNVHKYFIDKSNGYFQLFNNYQEGREFFNTAHGREFLYNVAGSIYRDVIAHPDLLLHEVLAFGTDSQSAAAKLNLKTYEDAVNYGRVYADAVEHVTKVFGNDAEAMLERYADPKFRDLLDRIKLYDEEDKQFESQFNQLQEGLKNTPDQGQGILGSRRSEPSSQEVRDDSHWEGSGVKTVTGLRLTPDGRFDSLTGVRGQEASKRIREGSTPTFNFYIKKPDGTFSIEREFQRPSLIPFKVEGKFNLMDIGKDQEAWIKYRDLPFPEFQRWAESKGYHGFFSTAFEQPEFRYRMALFDNNDVRAILSGDEGKTLMVRSDVSEDGFYSAVSEALTNTKLPKEAKGERWINLLRNSEGVKAEELDWTGMDTWLDEHKNDNLSLEDVQNFAKNHAVTVKFTQGGGLINPRENEIRTKIAQWKDSMDDSFNLMEKSGNYDPSLIDYHKQKIRSLELELRQVQNDNTTHYQNYQMKPKGEDYVEVRMSIPNLTKGDTRNYLNRVEDVVGNHFGRDLTNTIAHFRGANRMFQGKKSFTLEEAQSDWHQKGAEQGYTTAKEKLDSIIDNSYEGKVLDMPFKTSWLDLTVKKALHYAVQTGADLFHWTTGETQMDRWSNDLRGRVESIEYERVNQKDSAFYKSQADRYMRQMEEQNLKISEANKAYLRYVEEYRRADFNNEDSANQYDEFQSKSSSLYRRLADARKTYDDLSRLWNQFNEKYKASINGDSSKVTIWHKGVGEERYSDSVSLHVPHNGEFEYMGQKTTMNQVFGREMADTMRNNEKGIIEGDTLTIGGGLYKYVYDDKIPSIIKKQIKRLTGESVEPVRARDDASGEGIWSVPISQALKERVLEGQTLMMREGTRQSIEANREQDSSEVRHDRLMNEYHTTPPDKAHTDQIDKIIRNGNFSALESTDMEGLKKDLSAMGINFIEVKGAYTMESTGKQEVSPSLFAYYKNPDIAMVIQNIANKHNQESVFHGSGGDYRLEYFDGSTRKATGIEVNKAQTNDFGQKFQKTYADEQGIKLKGAERPYLQVPDESFMKELSKAYQEAKSEPDSPEVQKSYNALVSETNKQFDSIKGLKIEPWNGNGEPYKNSKEMRDDVESGHYYYLKTESQYGNSDGTNPIMLEDSGKKDSTGRELPNNDVFRIVHDIMGHTGHNFEFGIRGEYNAFASHAELYSKDAFPALASETLMQNSVVADKNYTREGNKYKLNKPKVEFAEQKAFVPSPELTDKIQKTLQDSYKTADEFSKDGTYVQLPDGRIDFAADFDWSPEAKIPAKEGYTLAPAEKAQQDTLQVKAGNSSVMTPDEIEKLWAGDVVYRDATGHKIDPNEIRDTSGQRVGEAKVDKDGNLYVNFGDEKVNLVNGVGVTKDGTKLYQHGTRRDMTASVGLFQELTKLLNPNLKADTKEQKARVLIDHVKGLLNDYQASDLEKLGDQWYNEGVAEFAKRIQRDIPDVQNDTVKLWLHLVTALTSPRTAVRDNAKWATNAMASIVRFYESGKLEIPRLQYDSDGNIMYNPDSTPKKLGIGTGQMEKVDAMTKGYVPLNSTEGQYMKSQGGKVVNGKDLFGENAYKAQGYFNYVESPTLKAIIDKHGELNGVLEFLLSPSLDGTKFNKSSDILGDKLGAFFSNLAGFAHIPTIDTWMNRYFMGILGDAVSVERDNGVLKSVKDNTQNFKTETGDLFRAAIQKATYEWNDANGGKLTPMDVQAVIWTRVKDLFNSLTKMESENDDFAGIYTQLSNKAQTVTAESNPALLEDASKRSPIISQIFDTPYKHEYGKDFFVEKKGLTLAVRSSSAREKLNKQIDMSDEDLANGDFEAWQRVAEGQVSDGILSRQEVLELKRLSDAGDVTGLQNFVAGLNKMSILQLAANVLRANPLLGAKNLARNSISNETNQLLYEISKLPAAVVDLMTVYTLKGANKLTGSDFNTDRSVLFPDIPSTIKSLYYGQTQGYKVAFNFLVNGGDSDFEHPMMFRDRTTGILALRPLEIYQKYVHRLQEAADKPYKTQAMYRALDEIAKFKAKNEGIDYAVARNSLDTADYDRATDIALHLTFQDSNALASYYYSAKEKTPPTIKAILDTAFPYVKTPLNVVDTTLNYSGIYPMMKLAYKNMKFADWQAFKDNAIKVLDTPEDRAAISFAVGKGLTGWTMTYIGFKLGMAGILSSFFNDKDRKENEQMTARGQGHGSVVYNGRSYEISAFNPIAFYLLAGGAWAEEQKTHNEMVDKFAQRQQTLETQLKEAQDSDNQRDVAIITKQLDELKTEQEKALGKSPLGNWTTRIAKEIAMQTPLVSQGVRLNDNLSKDGLGKALFDTFVGANRALPTLLGETAQTMDRKARFTRNDSIANEVTDTVKSMIPKVRETLPLKYDMLGRPIDAPIGFDPTKSKTLDTTPAENELDRLNVILPKDMKLKPEDRNADTEKKGQFFIKYITDAINSPEYQSSDDSTKRKILENTTRMMAPEYKDDKLKPEEENHNLEIMRNRESFIHQLSSNPAQFDKEFTITDKKVLSQANAAGINEISLQGVLKAIGSRGLPSFITKKFNYEYNVNKNNTLTEAQKNFENFKANPAEELIKWYISDQSYKERTDRLKTLREKLIADGKTPAEVEKAIHSESSKLGYQRRATKKDSLTVKPSTGARFADTDRNYSNYGFQIGISQAENEFNSQGNYIPSDGRFRSGRQSKNVLDYRKGTVGEKLNTAMEDGYGDFGSFKRLVNSFDDTKLTPEERADLLQKARDNVKNGFDESDMDNPAYEVWYRLIKKLKGTE